MTYLNLHTDQWHLPEFRHASEKERGVWISLMLYCAEIESSLIESCSKWSAKQWIRSLAIEKKPSTSSNLWRWEGESLRVWGFPEEKLAQIQANREDGKKGGRPKKDNLPVLPPNNPPVIAPANPAGNQKGREGKGIEEKGSGSSNADATTTTDEQLPSAVDSLTGATPVIPDNASDSGEKKKGAGILSLESREFQVALNVALGRAPGHPLSGSEMSALVIQFPQGLASEADLLELEAFLMASPRYDSLAEREWSAVPEKSLLRRRKRRACRVIDDLANQIAEAQQWAKAIAAEKEKGGGVSSLRNINEEPAGDWRGWALKHLGLTWAGEWKDLLDRLRGQIVEGMNS